MKPADACYFLENKAYFMPPPENDEEIPDTPFRCLKTHEAFGPDGDFACEETCGPHRRCYKPEIEL